MAVTHGYLETAELRDVLRDQLTAYDHEYERAIGAASRQIDDYCGRFFWKEASPTPRLFRPDECDLLWTGDIATSVDLVLETDDDGDGVFETTWSATDYQLEPFELMNGRPYERIAAVGDRDFPVDSLVTSSLRRRRSRRARVRVTAVWGWPAVPDEVKQACSILAVDHFKAKDLTHIAASYGTEVRMVRDYQYSSIGRRIRFNRMRAPTINKEAEALLAPLRTVVVA